MSIEDDAKAVDDWWKSKNYLKNQLNAMTWVEQVKAELGEFDSYRPLGDCPFFRKLPITAIEKCYKENKNGTCHVRGTRRSICDGQSKRKLCK